MKARRLVASLSRLLASLAGLKEGDEVRFVADRTSGTIAVTHIGPAK